MYNPRFSFLFVILMLGSMNIYGQPSTLVDSLHQEYLNADSIKAKLLILNQLCRYTQRSQPVLGRKYATAYDSLAQIGGNTIAKGKGKTLIGSSDYLSGDLVNATSRFLEGLEYFTTAQDSGFIGSAYNNLAVVHIARKDTTSCIDYLRKAYDLYKVNGHPRRLAISCNNLGSLLYAIGKFDEATTFAERRIAYHKEDNANDEVGKPMEILVDIARDTGNYNEAIKIANQALGFLNPEKSTPTLIRLNTKMAHSYLELDNLNAALKSLQSAQNLVSGKSFIKEKKSLLHTWSQYYKKSGQWQKALYAHEEYVLIYKHLNAQRICFNY